MQPPTADIVQHVKIYTACRKHTQPCAELIVQFTRFTSVNDMLSSDVGVFFSPFGAISNSTNGILIPTEYFFKCRWISLLSSSKYYIARYLISLTSINPESFSPFLPFVYYSSFIIYLQTKEKMSFYYFEISNLS